MKYIVIISKPEIGVNFAIESHDTREAALEALEVDGGLFMFATEDFVMKEYK